jgi:citrate synthase
MPSQPNGPVPTAPPAHERRKQPREEDPRWRTAITRIEPNKILVRGYPVDELMGRLSFAEAIYLILRGELPSRTIGQLFDAALISSIDHGVTPPSTLAARNVATTGAPLRASIAAGVLGFGAYHGGDIETCMRFIQQGLSHLRDGLTHAQAAERLLREFEAAGQRPPGFGHRVHSSDPRAVRLLEMAHELELDGDHVRMIRTIERMLTTRHEAGGPALPLNVDGAIAAVCGDMGFEPELGNALFMIARVPGLIAHATEERSRQQPMRQIDPKDAVYDGPHSRRLTQTRK